MEIVEQLQVEAAHRAGSPEGFLQVIHLVLDGIASDGVPPYLASYREYVSLVQEGDDIRHQLACMRQGRDDESLKKLPEYGELQKRLSSCIHAARRILRHGLPPAVRDMLMQLEKLQSARVYRLPIWNELSSKVESRVILNAENERFFYRYMAENEKGELAEMGKKAWGRFYGNSRAVEV